MMNCLRKIILLCAIHCVLSISRLGLEWNQRLSTDMKWLSETSDDERFYDMLPGENSNSLAVLDWINPNIDRTAGFNLTTITHNLEDMKMEVKECFFPAQDDIEFRTPVRVTYLRKNRVLVYFTMRHKTKGSIQMPQVIDTESCKLEEGTNTEPYVKFAAVDIVRFNDTFEVLFENKKLCPEVPNCRMTFDHDGKKISEPSSLLASEHNVLTDNDRIYPMSYESDKEGFAVVSRSSGIYSPIRGWIPTDDLKKTKHFYSNTSGYASVCWLTENLRNVKCTWLDGTHQDKKQADLVATIPLNGRVSNKLYTRNTPNGKIAMLKEGRDNGEKVIFSDKADIKGKCKRYMKVEFKNELKRVQLSFVHNGKSCVSFVTRNPDPVSDNNYSSVLAYKFESKCAKLSNDFHPEKIDCGKDYVS